MISKTHPCRQRSDSQAVVNSCHNWQIETKTIQQKLFPCRQNQQPTTNKPRLPCQNTTHFHTTSLSTAWTPTQQNQRNVVLSAHRAAQLAGHFSQTETASILELSSYSAEKIYRTLAKPPISSARRMDRTRKICGRLLLIRRWRWIPGRAVAVLPDGY